MKLHFANNQLDCASRQLWHDGREVRLSTKAFDLLALLAERRPAAVPKSDIKDRLWPETFVSDTNLPTLIAEVRDALGDDARQGQFIRTVHGFGYAQICGYFLKLNCQRSSIALDQVALAEKAVQLVVKGN